MGKFGRKHHIDQIFNTLRKLEVELSRPTLARPRILHHISILKQHISTVEDDVLKPPSILDA